MTVLLARTALLKSGIVVGVLAIIAGQIPAKLHSKKLKDNQKSLVVQSDNRNTIQTLGPNMLGPRIPNNVQIHSADRADSPSWTFDAPR
jgi:hypothetical protein